MIIFVGDRPSNRMKPGVSPFEGAMCEPRFNEWVGKIMPAFILWGQYPTVINQCDHTTLELIVMNKMGTKWVALGHNAEKALKKANITYFKLPHPSGRNRQINDKEFIHNKLMECRKWLDT